MKELRVCTAPVSKTQRCSNYTIGNSDLCKNHRESCRSLYLKYKKIQSKVDKFNLKSDDSNNVLKFYSLLSSLYEARRKHRLIAYSPECYDYGHDKQFEILMTRINECEQLLTDIFNKENSKEEKIHVENTEEEKEIKSDSLIKEVVKFRNIRKKDKEEDDLLLDQYIEANRDEYEYKSVIVELIDELLTKITVCFKVDNLCDIIIIKIGICNLLRQLASFGFFTDDFDLGMCQCCSEKSESITVPPIMCQCMQRHSRLINYPFRLFLNQVSIPTLEQIYHILNNRLVSLCPIISDLVQAYKIHGTNFVRCGFVLIKRDIDIKLNRKVFHLEEYNIDQTKYHNLTMDKLQRTSLNRLKEEFIIDKIADLIRNRNRDK